MTVSTITQAITAYPAAPDPATMTPAEFSAAAAAFVLAQKAGAVEYETFRGQVNTVGGEMNVATAATAQDLVDTTAQKVLAQAAASDSSDYAASAAGSANFVGAWSLQTGALAVPASVEHNGAIWILLSSLADVTASEPGVGVEWARQTNFASESRTANTILGPQDSGKLITYTSGTFSQTFEAAASLGEGWYVNLQNTGTGVVTCDPNGSETISGSTTSVIPGGVIDLLVCDGSNFTLYRFSKSAGDSNIVVTTGNGFGSTNTRIRRFTTAQEESGTAVTYADSATNGASFTINEDGIYSVMYTDSISAGTYANIGISLNSSELTTEITAITAADRLMSCATGDTTGRTMCSWSGRLSKGDVVRAHCEVGGKTFTSAVAQNVFVITKIGN